MKIIKNLEHNPNLVLALGFFDGIHSAHQKLIEEAVKTAGENTLKSAVITFKNHPLVDLKGINVEYLYDNNDKYKFIEELNVDYIYELNFNELKDMSADEYIKNVLYKYFEPKYIITGFNHTFGKYHSGDRDFLEKNQNAYNYIYKMIEPVYLKGELVSTTNIKDKLSKGQIELANKMLNKNFKITNEVKKGNQIGRTLGFPTINLNWPEGIFKLPYGVYGGYVLGHKALINWGVRPTVDGKKEILEAHILDFNADLYGQKADVFFEKKIRDEKKFKSVSDLKHQISVDLSSI